MISTDCPLCGHPDTDHIDGDTRWKSGVSYLADDGCLHGMISIDKERVCKCWLTISKIRKALVKKEITKQAIREVLRLGDSQAVLEKALEKLKSLSL